MGLIAKLLTLPVAGPGAGAIWLARRIHEAAEAEVSNPAALRRALRDLELRLESGEIDEPEFEELELLLLERLRSCTP